MASPSGDTAFKENIFEQLRGYPKKSDMVRAWVSKELGYQKELKYRKNLDIERNLGIEITWVSNELGYRKKYLPSTRRETSVQSI